MHIIILLFILSVCNGQIFNIYGLDKNYDFIHDVKSKCNNYTVSCYNSYFFVEQMPKVEHVAFEKIGVCQIPNYDDTPNAFKAVSGYSHHMHHIKSYLCQNIYDCIIWGCSLYENYDRVKYLLIHTHQN